jgi:hypothetical protein
MKMTWKLIPSSFAAYLLVDTGEGLYYPSRRLSQTGLLLSICPKTQPSRRGYRLFAMMSMLSWKVRWAGKVCSLAQGFMPPGVSSLLVKLGCSCKSTPVT